MQIPDNTGERLSSVLVFSGIRLNGDHEDYPGLRIPLASCLVKRNPDQIIDNQNPVLNTNEMYRVVLTALSNGWDYQAVAPPNAKENQAELDHEDVEFGANTAKAFVSDRLALFYERRIVVINGVATRMPDTDLMILEFLLRNPSKINDRDTILETVWGDTFLSTRNVDLAVNRIRSKLGPDAHTLIRSVRTTHLRDGGYEWTPEVSDTLAAVPSDLSPLIMMKRENGTRFNLLDRLVDLVNFVEKCNSEGVTPTRKQIESNLGLTSSQVSNLVRELRRGSHDAESPYYGSRLTNPSRIGYLYEKNESTKVR